MSYRRLKHVASVAISSVDKKSVEGEVPVKLCNYTDVYYNDRITAKLPMMQATATHDQITSFGLRSGDVLLTKDSETPDDIAVPAYVEDDLPDIVCGYHLALLRPKPGTDGRFLFWALASSSSREQFAASANGITRFGLRYDTFGEVSIPLPEIQRQRAIADYLDRETASIDTLIEQNRVTIALLVERAQSIIAGSWPGRLILSPDGTPVGIEGWRCVRLGHLARIQTGFTLDDGRDVRADADIYQYVRVANVQDGALNLDEVKEVVVPRALADRCLLRAGDVLMTEGGDPDKLGRGTVWPGDIRPCLHQNHVFAVRPAPELLPEYLALITRTPYARAYFEMTASKTTGIASTSTAKIASFRIPFVTPEVQLQILSSVSQRLDEVETLRMKVAAQTRLLAERRKALITAAVTGGVEVPGVAA